MRSWPSRKDFRTTFAPTWIACPASSRQQTRRTRVDVGSPHMKPSKDWKERVEPGEEARFEKLAKDLHAVQRGTDRTLHAKGFGVEGELAISPNLPEHAHA